MKGCPFCLASRTARHIVVLLLLIAATPATAFSNEALYAQAKSFLASGENDKAYWLLERETQVLGGEPTFDYLLGRAALLSHRPEQAMFALERVVQEQPGNAAARMELVQAYIALDMNRQAQEQLAILDTQSPPPAAREAMTRFEDILRPRLSGIPDPVRLVGLSEGYDSNVGSYPDVGLDLGGILLSVEPVESSYQQFRGTVWHPIRLNNRQRLDFTLHTQIRQYNDEDAKQFNLGLLHNGFLLNTTLDPLNKVGAGVQLNKLWLDGHSFRDHVGVNGFWERRLGPDYYGQLGLKLFRYQFEQSSNNYDLTSLSGELNKRWSPTLRTRLMLDLDYEKADAQRLGGDAMRYKLGGSIDYRLNRRNQISSELSWSSTEYKEEYRAGTLYNLSASDEARDDKTVDLAMHWRHLLTRDWQVDTDLTYRTQDSSLRFYDVERWTAQLTVLRYF